MGIKNHNQQISKYKKADSLIIHFATLTDHHLSLMHFTAVILVGLIGFFNLRWLALVGGNGAMFR